MTHTLRGLSAVQILRMLGQRAGALRDSLGRSQAQVANSAGLSRATISRFETGKSVDVEAVIRIAIALEAEESFASLFPASEPASLDELLAEKLEPRRRGRPRKPA